MEKTTYEILTDTVRSEIETYPLVEIILAYVKTHEGKSVSKRDVKKLEEANPTLQFTLADSWSTASLVVWEKNNYSETRKEIVVSRTVKNKKFLTAEEVVNHNQNRAYFGAARERNEARAILLNPETGKLLGLKKVADLTDQLALLHAEIKATIEAYELDSGVEYKVTALLKEKTGNDIKFY